MTVPRPAPDTAASAPAAHSPRRGWPWVAGAALFGLLASALLAYVLTPYAALRDWYLHRTPNLYRAASWPTDFFTPAVKARGDVLAGLALAGLVASFTYLWLGKSRPVAPAAPLRPFTRADRPWLAGLLVLAASLWASGATQVPPAYDEVFSVVYGAGSGSLLVAWSYYMLPNNHLLFNLLNGSLFGWLHNLPLLVLTGRMLSGLAYAGTLAVGQASPAGAGWGRG
jgi:hypothetical protein